MRLGSTDTPPTARRNAGASAGGIGVASPSGGVRPAQAADPPGLEPVSSPCEGQRAADESDFFCCDRPGCEDHFLPSKRSPCQRFCSPACRQALRRVLDASGDGGSGYVRPGETSDQPVPRAVSWLTRMVGRPHRCVRFHCPQEGGRCTVESQGPSGVMTAVERAPSLAEPGHKGEGNPEDRVAEIGSP